VDGRASSEEIGIAVTSELCGRGGGTSTPTPSVDRGRSYRGSR
jgi:hypothetical protein